METNRLHVFNGAVAMVIGAASGIGRALAQWERLRPTDPAIFAEKVLDQVAANRAIIIVPAWWKLFWWICRHAPALGMRLADITCRDTKRELGL